MINIMLCCASGMSTSLLVEKMKKAAAEEGVEVNIWAVGANEVKANATKLILFYLDHKSDMRKRKLNLKRQVFQLQILECVNMV